jgi:hypothetical protein
LVDTDAKTSVISEEAYQSIAATGYPGLLLSKAQVELDCGGLYTRIFDQYVHLIFKIDGDTFEQIFLVVPELIVPVILGADFQQENQFVIDYQEKYFWKGDKKYERYDFSSTTGHMTESGTNVTYSDHSSEAQTFQFALLPSQPALLPSQPALMTSQPANQHSCQGSQDS